jgi:uncharacterized membrane protein YcaP (DUF421 family)
MDSILRSAAVYFFVLLVLRISGRRTLGEMTNFDLVILLIISESTQNAMVGEDYSLTNCFLIVLTLVSADIGLSLLKQKMPRIERWLDGVPTILVENGRPLHDRMRRERVDRGDILEAARESQGLERMEQIKFAVLERKGKITIIPKSDRDAAPSGHSSQET